MWLCKVEAVRWDQTPRHVQRSPPKQLNVAEMLDAETPKKQNLTVSCRHNLGEPGCKCKRSWKTTPVDLTKAVVPDPCAEVKRLLAQRFSPGARHAFLVFTRVLLRWHLAVFVLASPGVVMKISATHNGCRDLENKAQS